MGGKCTDLEVCDIRNLCVIWLFGFALAKAETAATAESTTAKLAACD